jgi:taurine dioxygenase
MTVIDVSPLQDGLPYGARVRGMSLALTSDEAVRARVNEVFLDRGLILFEDVEPTDQMQVALSTIFGPLKDHPMKAVARVDKDTMVGVIKVVDNPEMAIVEVDGKRLATWQPWHFDHCYNNELNRAAVLRPVVIAPEDGRTAFADGIQMYDALSPEGRARAERMSIIYTMDLLYAHMRFGRPKNFREIRPSKGEISKAAQTLPRAVHPAVWTRTSREKVLHVSPWMAVGVEHHEDAAGDAELTALCEEMYRTMQPYIHAWAPRDMIVWDNWRMLHQACGCDPQYARLMHRTTIKGDYGLGYFEHGRQALMPEEVM